MAQPNNQITGIVMLLVAAAFIGGFVFGNALPYALPFCRHPEFERDALRIELNEKRLEAGRPQAFDRQILEDYAKFRLDEITKTQNYSHETSLSLAEWAKRENRQHELTDLTPAFGEALTTQYFTTCGAVHDLMDSPTHRDGLLSADVYGLAINDKYLVVITGNVK